MGLREGLAAGSRDPNGLWNKLVVQLSLTPERECNIQVLRGFVKSLHEINRSLSECLLDDAVQHDILAPWLPELQTAIPVDEPGVERLERALALGKAPVGAFSCLGLGGSSDLISEAKLRALLLSIAARTGGFDVAIGILSMRLHSDNHQKRPHDADLVRASRQLLQQLPLDRHHGRDEYRLGIVLETALAGCGGGAAAQDIYRKLKAAISKGETYGLSTVI